MKTVPFADLRTPLSLRTTFAFKTGPKLGFYFDRDKMDVKSEGAKPLAFRGPGTLGSVIGILELFISN